jgi:hypothetical protein
MLPLEISLMKAFLILSGFHCSLNYLYRFVSFEVDIVIETSATQTATACFDLERFSL